MKTWSSPLALWAAPPSGCLAALPSRDRLLPVEPWAQKRSGDLERFLLCLKTGDILFLTPVVVRTALHVPGKEAGGLPVRGTTIARNKMEKNLFYAFRGGGRKDHVDTLGLVFCLVLQVLQDEELAEEHHSLSGTNCCAAACGLVSIDFIFSQKPTGWVTVQEKILRNVVNREKKSHLSGGDIGGKRVLQSWGCCRSLGVVPGHGREGLLDKQSIE